MMRNASFTMIGAPVCASQAVAQGLLTVCPRRESLSPRIHTVQSIFGDPIHETSSRLAVRECSTSCLRCPRPHFISPVLAADTIKVGILHSLSGTMAISETALKDMALMTIDEINAKGGVMGKKLEPVVVDPASNWPLFAEKARS